ncbi:hypothetical protein G4B88_007938 [Cannabis sativa]|uniref:Uncharacterized protein n=1 Tax=Cannabis sativa TaxID=3483 RepID=A0A7J6I6R1_CANSA|nr:hypothetical protein G4B88_007938 [Cannabis sativa]
MNYISRADMKVIEQLQFCKNASINFIYHV